MAEQLTGDTGAPPYPQFEKCPHLKEYECKYIQLDGNCIFEHCIYEKKDEPKEALLHFSSCVFCHKAFAREPRANKIHICETCIQRINGLEVLPMKCRACGKTINKPELDYIFLGLCRNCVDNWRDMIIKEHYELIVRCYNCNNCPECNAPCHC